MNHGFLLPLILIHGLSFVRGMASAQHNFFFLILSLLLTSKGGSIVVEPIEGVVLGRFFYFLCKLELGQETVIFRFSIIGRPFSLPSHALIGVIVFGFIPPF